MNQYRIEVLNYNYEKAMKIDWNLENLMNYYGHVLINIMI